MYPTLRPGDRILFDRLAYKLSDPQPGDIVLARHLSRPRLLFIKRIASSDSSSLGVRFQPDTGKGGGYHLLGDNPEASTDSRTLGPFRREDVLAKAWLIYWPRDRFRRL
jgi:signal peptidase I